MVGVTGATGFIGRSLVDALVAAGVPVRCLLRSTTGAQPRNATEFGGSGDAVEITVGDLHEVASLERFLSGIEVVIHAAGVTRSREASGYYRGNAEGTARLLEGCVRYGVQRLVYLSTIDVSLALPDAYSQSKAAGEAAVRASGLVASIIRPSVVYGPGDTKNLAAVLALIQRAHVVPIPGRGDFQRQPIFVDDLVGLVTEHAIGPSWSGVRVVTAVGPDVLSFRGLVDGLARAAGTWVVPVRVPVAALRLVGALARPLVGENQFELLARGAGDRTAAALPAGSPVWVGPTHFAAGLRRTLVQSAPAA